MRFQSLNDEELNRQKGLLTAGDGTYEVLEAIEGNSKNSGQLQIQLKLKVTDCQGFERFIYDYLPSTAQWKIKEFCVSIGYPEFYTEGNLTEGNCLEKKGMCKIGVSQATPTYDAKNKILKYLPAGTVPQRTSFGSSLPPSTGPVGTQGFDDEIPF